MRYNFADPRDIGPHELRRLLSEKEGLNLEFKLNYEIPPKGPDREKYEGEQVKDIIGLANSAGTEHAYLSIGAGDKLDGTGQRRHESVKPRQYRQEDLRQKVNERCTPEIRELFYREVELDGGLYGIIIIPP
jgi:hypothetical protein